MKKLANLSIFIFSIIWFSACDEQRVYEQNVDLQGNDWYMDSIPSFSFEVSDTNEIYNLSLNLRNAIDYPYSNIYIKYFLADSTGKEINSSLVRLFLFNEKTGEPFGDGLGDIFDHQFLLLKDFRFPYAGKYQVKLQQYMRKDPLPFIVSVGVRIEKSQPDPVN